MPIKQRKPCKRNSPEHKHPAEVHPCFRMSMMCSFVCGFPACGYVDTTLQVSYRNILKRRLLNVPASSYCLCCRRPPTMMRTLLYQYRWLGFWASVARPFLVSEVEVLLALCLSSLRVALKYQLLYLVFLWHGPLFSRSLAVAVTMPLSSTPATCRADHIIVNLECLVFGRPHIQICRPCRGVSQSSHQRPKSQQGDPSAWRPRGFKKDLRLMAQSPHQIFRIIITTHNCQKVSHRDWSLERGCWLLIVALSDAASI